MWVESIAFISAGAARTQAAKSTTTTKTTSITTRLLFIAYPFLFYR